MKTRNVRRRQWERYMTRCKALMPDPVSHLVIPPGWMRLYGLTDDQIRSWRKFMY